MRRTVIGAASAVALALTALPGVAAAATRVDGDHFQAAGLKPIRIGCSDPTQRPTKPAPFAVTRSDPDSGRSSIGWVPEEEGFAYGLTAPLAQPTKLSTFSIRLQTVAPRTQGVAMVTYNPPADDGYWIGTTDLITDLNQDDKPDWRTIDGSTLTYNWRHFTPDGTQDQTSFPQDLQTFAQLRGGDGEGAEIGFAFGCDGNTFRIDRLKVGQNDFDLEGYRTKASFAVGGKAVGKKTSIIYGQAVQLQARLRETLTGSGVSGEVLLQNRQLTAKKWKTVKTLKLGANGNAGYRAVPGRSTAYRLVFPGTAPHDPATSAVFKVMVQPNVTGRISASTVKVGQRFTISGRILPRRAAPIMLQKYNGKRWSTVVRGKAQKNGKYSVGTVAKNYGRSFWRVRVAAGGGNVAGQSVWLKLRTVKPSGGGTGGGTGGGGTGGGGTGGGENPTPPPPTEPPPPPPPGS